MTELSSFNREEIKGWRLELGARSELQHLAKEAWQNRQATHVDVCVHDSLADKKTATEVVALFRGTVGDRLQKLTRIELYPGTGGYNLFPIEALTAVLQAHHGTLETLSVYHLDLRGDMIKFREFAAILERCRVLTEVCFIDCRVTSTVEEGLVSDNNPFVPVLSSLAQLSSLKVVALWAANDDPMSALTQESLMQICGSSSLDRLLLMGFSITDAEAAGAFQAVESNRSLRRLHLSCRMGPQACTALQRMLRTNGKLEKLKIDLEEHRTLEHEDRLVEIAQGLRENKCIHYFKLSGSFGSCGSDKSVEAFEQTLRENSTLQALSVLDGSIYSPRMAFYLKLNQIGRKEILQSAKREVWVDGLINANGDMDCLFYFLLANPSLLATTTTTAVQTE